MLGATQFDYHGLGTLKVYALLESEMESLNSLSGRESAAIGLFWGCFGAFVSALLGLLLSFPTTPASIAIYVSVTAALALGSVAFGVQWYFARRDRNAMVKAIRARAPTPVSLQLSPSASRAS